MYKYFVSYTMMSKNGESGNGNFFVVLSEQITNMQHIKNVQDRAMTGVNEELGRNEIKNVIVDNFILID